MQRISIPPNPGSELTALPELTSFESALSDHQDAMFWAGRARLEREIVFAQQYEIAAALTQNTGKMLSEKARESYVLLTPEYQHAAVVSDDWNAHADARRHLVIHLRNTVEER
jgi:hypothetical protein